MSTLHSSQNPETHINTLHHNQNSEAFTLECVYDGRTPELIVVCTAAGLLTAVAGLTQVSAAAVGSGAVARAAQER